MNFRLGTRLSLLVGLTLAVLLPTAATASTMFELESGSVSFTVYEYAPGDGLSLLANTFTIDIDSVQLVIDPDTQEIVSFDLVIDSPTEFTLLSDSSAYLTYTSLILESFALSVTDGTLVADGTGYSFDGDAYVTAVLGGTSEEGRPLADSSLSVSGDVPDGPLYWDVLDPGMISLNGMAVGFFDSPLDENYLVMTADFQFTASASAPVPEPNAMLLFIVGFLVTGGAARRRRFNGGTKYLR